MLSLIRILMTSSRRYSRSLRKFQTSLTFHSLIRIFAVKSKREAINGNKAGKGLVFLLTDITILPYYI